MLWTLILLAGLPSGSDAHSQWIACLSEKGSAFARSTETTETAAIATLGACKQQESEYFAQAYRTPTFERMITGPRRLDAGFRDAQDARRAREVEDARQQIIAGIAELRAGIPH